MVRELCFCVNRFFISYYLSSSNNRKFDALLSKVITHSQPEDFAECAINRSERSILVSRAEETKFRITD